MTRHSISIVGQRIMRLLIGHPPQKMTDLIKATGVTRTAISEQLNDLIAMGYVAQNLERLTGRGRPRYLYSATEYAMKQLFEGNQNLVVPAVWRAIKQHAGGEVVQKVCESVASEIADHFNRKITATAPAERLKQFNDIICQKGRLGIFRETNGCCELDKLNCPFISMYDSSGFVCEIDMMTMSKIVGSQIERVKCRLHGEHCCTFRICNNDTANVDVSLDEY